VPGGRDPAPLAGPLTGAAAAVRDRLRRFATPPPVPPVPQAR
jgi:hypothetical protein